MKVLLHSEQVVSKEGQLQGAQVLDQGLYDALQHDGGCSLRALLLHSMNRFTIYIRTTDFRHAYSVNTCIVVGK